MEQILFSLLRLGLKNSSVDRENVDVLFMFTEKEWIELEELSRNQGISAIVFDGLVAIMDVRGNSCFDHFNGSSFWRKFITSWAFVTVEHACEARYYKQLSVIDDIQRRWAKDGIRTMIMKGLAIATFYPTPRHRCPGDIDCYLLGDYAKGNDVAQTFADRVDEGWYKHSQILYRGEVIENHLFFVHTREGKSSKDLNRVLCNTLDNVDFEILPGTSALIPPPMFNALFLVYHSLSHFLEEGLRLKQVIDWAVFIKKDANKINWEEFYKVCNEFHLRRFADILTDIAVHYLGIELGNSMITSTSPYTDKVIDSTLNDNDYVFGSGKGNWTNRLHIVTNLFKYRWKYHRIYQHSVLRQLWFYAYGFIFKTE